MCPAHSEKSRYIRKKLLADDSLIDNILPFLNNFNYTIKNIQAGAVWGEPLIDDKYFSNNEKLMRACPNASLYLTTNGSLLTSDNIEKILSKKYIKRIGVSVDAGNKETYEQIRKGGKWDTLLHNLSMIIERKKQQRVNTPVILTNFVIMKSNFKELPQYIKKMGKLGVDVISAVNPHNCYSTDSNSGIFDLPFKINNFAAERKLVLEQAMCIKLPKNTLLNLPSFTPRKESAECSFNGASRVIIGIEGEVYPCCVHQSLDYEGNQEAKPMGNVYEEKLESILKEKRFLDFRHKMLRGQSPSTICSNCPFFYGM
jgi:radical SAM protein with 4Fe4S-binding SPASM domain